MASRMLKRLGESNASICVYIGNRPNFDFEIHDYDSHLLSQGEIQAVGKACGNGWRKVFNVYAKWLYACPEMLYPQAQQFSNWQQFRDQLLLQKDSSTALIFEPPTFSDNKKLHLIMGRTYAKTLVLPSTLVWINEEFGLDIANNLVICPYFDYRQLSDRKIAFLIHLIKSNLSLSQSPAR